MAALVLYVTAVGLLELALRRDPQPSRRAVVAGAGLFLLALVLGPVLGWRDVGVGFLAVATLGLTLRVLGAAQLLLLCGSLAVMALLGEAVLRLPWVVRRTGGSNPGMLAWESRHYDDVERRNPLGLRSFHTAKAKAAGVRRIVVLGDSFSHGDLVARTGDLWPYVLERAIAQESGLTVEAINLGRGGLTTVNEAELLEEMGWRFQPDLVVVQFTLNDPLPSGPRMQHHNDGWFFGTVPLLPRFHPWLNNHSYFYSFVNMRFWALQMSVSHPRGYAALYDDAYPGWIACRAALGEMAASARNHGVPMLVLLFPLFVDDLSTEGYPYLEPHRKIREAAEEAGIPLLDLRPVLASRDRRGRVWWAYPCDWHPSVEAHGVAGEALASEILTRRLLPGVGD